MQILLSKKSPKNSTKKGDLMLTTLILLLDFQATVMALEFLIDGFDTLLKDVNFVI